MPYWYRRLPQNVARQTTTDTAWGQFANATFATPVTIDSKRTASTKLAALSSTSAFAVIEGLHQNWDEATNTNWESQTQPWEIWGGSLSYTKLFNPTSGALLSTVILPQVGQEMAVTKLNSTTVAVMYNDKSLDDSYVVLMDNQNTGNTVTVGTASAWSTSEIAYGLRITPLSSSSFAIWAVVPSTQEIMCTYYTFSGLTLTLKATTAFTSSETISKFDVAASSATEVCAVWRTADGSLKARAATFNATTGVPTLGTAQVLIDKSTLSTPLGCNYPCIAAVNTNKYAFGYVDEEQRARHPVWQTRFTTGKPYIGGLTVSSNTITKAIGERQLDTNAWHNMNAYGLDNNQVIFTGGQPNIPNIDYTNHQWGSTYASVLQWGDNFISLVPHRYMAVARCIDVCSIDASNLLFGYVDISKFSKTDRETFKTMKVTLP